MLQGGDGVRMKQEWGISEKRKGGNILNEEVFLKK